MTEHTTETDSTSQALVPASNTAADTEAALRAAIRFWADGSTRAETYERHFKLRDKIQAVGNFFAFAGKHPGEVTPEDVAAWRADLEARGQKPATVYARVSRVSAFFKWLMSDPVFGLHIRSNPAAQARPRYPQPYQSDSVKSLTDDEMNALLRAVRVRADAGAVVAMRDYALLLFFFLTGLRRNEVISLRGSDLEYKEGRLVIKYRRKGGKFVGREVEDPSVYAALVGYLRASGRENVLGSERPLWTRHDRAGKPGAPLSSRSFAENLKVYAREAGIEHIHVHQTRHTYARIVAEETGSYHETQEALDHENAATTRVYVQRITVKADKHGGKVARRIKSL
ncbi:MAG TPA: tyrosine-type recombinase/integrase [Pyrinomonadaceae bacterium]|nr:tyrosine-type recombinase/integrase [Pyrinomonadaceae bacterium]